jgi:hypothetical protein
MQMGIFVGGILPVSVGLPLLYNHEFQFAIPQQKDGLSRFQGAILDNCDYGGSDGETCKLGETHFKTLYYVPGYAKFSRLCLSYYKQYNTKISIFYVFTL